MALVLGQTSLASAGNWLYLANRPTENIGLLLLLPDGTVMTGTLNNSLAPETAWYRLSPDPYGHYVNGTWSTRGSMNDTRLYYASQVLTNGTLLVAGAEYGTGGSTVELYDPVADAWTRVPVPASLLDPTQNQQFADSISAQLPDGRVLIAPVTSSSGARTLIYETWSGNWSAGPAFGSGHQREASWVKLADGSILTVDPDSNNAERYVPRLNQWVAESPVPVGLYVSLLPKVGEIGPVFLLPNGKAFFLGGSGHTAIYTPSPSGGTNTGSWVIGPEMPAGLSAADAPAAMLPNGKILCALAPAPYVDGTGNVQYSKPTYFYEYDYTNGPGGQFEQVHGPTANYSDNISSFQACMLMLPDGSVLYSDQTSQLYIYVPDVTTTVITRPLVRSVRPNADGSYHVSGTGLTGASAGAAYGDDAQMDTSFPIVSFENLSDGSGHFDYGRTYNWSTGAVQTGNAILTCEFRLPPGLIPDRYGLRVTAAGISSEAYDFLAPVWLEFSNGTGLQNGSFNYPFNSLVQATNTVLPGGDIFIKSPGSWPGQIAIGTPMTIRAVGGPATIGQ